MGRAGTAHRMTGGAALKWTGRIIAVAAVAAAVVALLSELDSGSVVVWPSGWQLASAGVLVGTGLWLSSSVWVHLLGDDLRSRAHRADFFVAQIGKYIPGGIWQPLGQIGISAQRGMGKRQLTIAMVTHAVIQVSAGLLLSMWLVANDDLDPWVRWAAVAAGLSSLALPAVYRAAERRSVIPRVLSDLRMPDKPVKQLVLLGVNLILLGGAFAVAASVALDQAPWTVLAFAAAWTVGFLVVPVPAGLGVREAVLVALVPVPAGTVVAASAILRVVTIIVEFALILGSRLRA